MKKSRLLKGLDKEIAGRLLSNYDISYKYKKHIFSRKYTAYAYVCEKPNASYVVKFGKCNKQSEAMTGLAIAIDILLEGVHAR